MTTVLINFREEQSVKDEFAAIAKEMGISASALLKLKMRETIREAKATPGFSFSNEVQLTAAQAQELASTPSAQKLDKTIYSIF